MKTNLYLVCFFVPVACFATAAETTENLPGDKVEQAHRTLWERFIGPHDIMYDYTDLDGTVVLPTPEECEKSMPNALAWWTPVENGGFFNGMYLVAQTKRYGRDPGPENREKVKRLVRGLYHLQDVGNTPGFIARGVGSDGKCHYVASSDDQNFPFILGLWHYLKTDIPSDEERKECRDRLVGHVESLEKNHWKIIGTRPHFVRGDCLGTDYHTAAFTMMTIRIMIDVTDSEKWKKFYDELLDENSPDGKLRRENLRRGPKDLAGWSAWFYSNCQYSVRELHRFEKDPALKELYAESLKNTARSALKLIGLYKKFDPETPKFFTPDWHRMMPPYREQKNSDESNKLAMEQHKVWCEACPAIQYEKTTLKPALCAAWIVSLSGDHALVDAVKPEILEMIRHPDYSRLHYATFFYAENLYQTLLESQRERTPN